LRRTSIYFIEIRRIISRFKRRVALQILWISIEYTKQLILLIFLKMSSSAVTSTLADPIKMPYRLLGKTGLQVSVLSYGFFATIGSKSDLQDTAGLEVSKACMRRARDMGVNLFDNAEMYGDPKGEAERLMGIALKDLQKEDPQKWRRSDILITTKIFFGFLPGVNEKGLSKKHIEEGVDAALARLQLTYVDLLFCHRPDPFTPTETVVRAMNDVVRSGRAMAWGTSEWSAQQITEGKSLLFLVYITLITRSYHSALDR
jgi:aryl-alcohol dehydrogenase-like predicted oxidoreductase